MQYPVLRTAQSAYTLYFPDRPVQSNTVSSSNVLGRMQPYATINARSLHVHISTTVYSQVQLYSWVNWSNVEWKNVLKVLTPQHRIRTRVHLVESQKFYPWAIALFKIKANSGLWNTSILLKSIWVWWSHTDDEYSMSGRRILITCSS